MKINEQIKQEERANMKGNKQGQGGNKWKRRLAVNTLNKDS